MHQSYITLYRCWNCDQYSKQQGLCPRCHWTLPKPANLFALLLVVGLIAAVLPGCKTLSNEDKCEVACDIWSSECHVKSYQDHLWCSDECKRRLPDLAIDCQISVLSCDNPKMVDGSCFGL